MIKNKKMIRIRQCYRCKKIYKTMMKRSHICKKCSVKNKEKIKLEASI